MKTISVLNSIWIQFDDTWSSKNMNRSIFMQQFVAGVFQIHSQVWSFGGLFLGSSHTSSKGVWMYTPEDLKWNIMEAWFLDHVPFLHG